MTFPMGMACTWFDCNSVDIVRANIFGKKALGYFDIFDWLTIVHEQSYRARIALECEWNWQKKNWKSIGLDWLQETDYLLISYRCIPVSIWCPAFELIGSWDTWHNRLGLLHRCSTQSCTVDSYSMTYYGMFHADISLNTCIGIKQFTRSWLVSQTHFD